MVDVRDVALGHALILEHPEAGGERFIFSNGPYLWGELRKSPAHRDFLRHFDVNLLLCSKLVLVDFCDNEGDAAIKAGVKGIVPGTSSGFVAPMPELVFDGSKAARVLGSQYRPQNETVIDAIKSIHALYPEVIPTDS